MSERILGVDFSGARDAGRYIWIGETTAVGEALIVNACYPATELPGGGPQRETALAALRDYLAAQRGALVGLDFPPGLPRQVMQRDSWTAMLAHFSEDYPDAETFRARCREAGQGRDLRRRTDIEAATPFSPYNLRLYRQTYYGLRDLLAPLVRDGQVRVLPVQTAADDRPRLVESCPASTLKALGLYTPYKGKDAAMRAARSGVLKALSAGWNVRFVDGVRRVLVDDPGGDALDSVLAAFGLWAYLREGGDLYPPGDEYAVEGFVYVVGLRNIP